MFSFYVCSFGYALFCSFFCLVLVLVLMNLKVLVVVGLTQEGGTSVVGKMCRYHAVYLAHHYYHHHNIINTTTYTNTTHNQPLPERSFITLTNGYPFLSNTTNGLPLYPGWNKPYIRHKIVILSA